MGDPAGVGPELALRLLAEPGLAAVARLVLFGDLDVLERVGRLLNRTAPDAARVVTYDAWRAEMPDESSCDGPLIVDLKTPGGRKVQPGVVDGFTGDSAHRFIRAALDAVLTGRAAALTTGPIHKEALRAAGVPYPGHTELLEAATSAERTCMMLTSEAITCSLVTGHVGLGAVTRALTAERVRDTIELTAEAMRRLLGRTPRLAVCGLNPHAGEHGLIGEGEEERILEPALRACRDEGLELVGPLPPDTAFRPEQRSQVDAYICMYHDQGLIPLKMIAFDTAVNVTLGLPIIRTSVDHGTALDIAWRGLAKPTSLIAAVRLAARLASTPSNRLDPLTRTAGSL